MPTPADLVCTVRELGIKPAWLYARYLSQLRTGWIRLRTPVYSWEKAEQVYFRNTSGRQCVSEKTPEGVFALQKSLRLFLQQDEAGAKKRADDILSGRFSFFGQLQPLNMGFPPNWNQQPAFGDYQAGPTLPIDLHWSKVPTDTVTDIKYIWELSRFSWVFDLGRAYTATNDPRYYEAFWTLFDSWRTANAPNAGPQWISGQEVALRLMAVTFAMDVFVSQLGLQPERTRALQVFIAVHAARLPATLLYARSQGNNHLISEAVGLFTAGLVLPHHAAANRWRSLGRRWIKRALQQQVYPDGGYVQHSHTYARLALQAGLWAVVLAQYYGEPLAVSVLNALRRMAGLLYAVTDPESGHVPNFGPNDGALMLPLSSLPIQDFRPTVQAAFALLNNRRAYPPGPWDELVLWLGAGNILSAEEDPVVEARDFPSTRKVFPQAGLYLLGGSESRAFLRCANFTGRPGHSDQLHLDLWWNGEPLAVDAGTYLYNAPAPWQNSLVCAAVHNTLTLNNQDPMRRAGRFLLLDWAQGEYLGGWVSPDGRFELCTAQHDGYRRFGQFHRRSVLRIDKRRWLVLDDVFRAAGQKPGRAGMNADHVVVRLSWLLPDLPLTRGNTAKRRTPDAGLSDTHELRLDTSDGLVRLDLQGAGLTLSHYRAGELLSGPDLAGAQPFWGWISPAYGEKHPAHLVIAQCKTDTPVRLISTWTLGDAPLPETELTWRAPNEPGCVLQSLRCREMVWQPETVKEKGDR
ncbi:MAG: alginate lyase family protein [Anaerolineales bacterium]|nr:alginate lyase family protein [Anaerolineales bacterium]